MTDEARWPTELPPPFLNTVYGEDVPDSGHPPCALWDGQRAAVAKVVSHLVGGDQKYQEDWDRYADSFTNQKGQGPSRQPLHILT
eukprot:8503564-Pyramimonas_sp.AAC.1